MKHRFFVAADGMGKDEYVAFIEFLRDNKLGWWHCIPNVWLITDRSGKMTASALRDKISELRTQNATSCLVMQVHDDITWAGLYPNGSTKRDEFDWIKRTWNGE